MAKAKFGAESENSAKMKDVADLAGVSIKTVSRVLNSEPHVQEKLRRKVRDAAEALNYVPSQSAPSLRGHRSYNINLVCHNAVSVYVNAIQFGAVMEAAGLTVDPQLVRAGSFDFQSGYDAGQYFLEQSEGPTAVFSSNDDMAAGLVAAYTERGLKIPQDLCVVGFDDASIATCMRPFLTTMRQPLSDLGANSVHELVSTLSGTAKTPARRIVLDHEFVLRDTISPPTKH